MLKAEWQSIWKDKKYLLSIIVMFVMPVLYAGMLLWAFWDPYGKIDQLPVAIVNDDTGAELEGEKLTIGKDLIDNLKESKSFKFIEVDSDKVQQGLVDQQYYLYIRIPKNFSQHATTLLDENPQTLELEYKANESYNFLSSKIGDSAIKEIRKEVSDEVSKTYAEQLFGAIDSLATGFGEASDGAHKVTEGAAKLSEGAQDLEGYLQQLASSTVSLSDGTKKLYNGVIDASTGATKLEDGSQKLADGASQLAAGAKNLSEGALSLQTGIGSYTEGASKVQQGQAQIVEKQGELIAGTEKLADGSTELQAKLGDLAAGAQQVAGGLTQLEAQLQGVLAMLPEENKQALQQSLTQLIAGSEAVADGANLATEGASSLATGATELTSGAVALQQGQQQVLTGANQLIENNKSLIEGAASVAQGSNTLQGKLDEFSTGAQAVAAGTSDLKVGLEKLVSGTSTLNNGTTELSSKSAELAEGGKTLANGAGELVNGTTELEDGLTEAKEEATIQSGEKNYKMVASPVEVDKEILNETKNYGTGLAPYFISLGLFVGALLLTNVYSFTEPARRPTSLMSWFISKSVVPFVVWVFQVAILVAILVLGLGLESHSLWQLILVTAITSFSFIAIVQVFTVVLGDVGRFSALVFLIIQLASSAGTFPVELIPKQLQFIHSWLPMTYSNRAFREVLASGNMDVIMHNLFIIGMIGVISLAITFISFAILFKYKYSKVEEKTVAE